MRYSVQRFRGGFAITWDDAGIRRRRKLAADTRAAADREAAQWWREQSGGGVWAVERCVMTYLESLAGRPSHERAVRAWKAAKPFWAAILPNQVTPALCAEYVEQRRAGPSTQAYEINLIGSAVSHCFKHRYIETPRRGFKAPSKPDRREGFMTPDQFRAFVGGCATDHVRLFAILSWATGARPSTIQELRWSQIDWDTRVLDLNPHGRAQTIKRRPVVPLNDMAMKALREAHRIATTPWVIEYGGKQVASVKKAIQRASQRSGVPAWPYIFRHSSAVQMAASGVSMERISQFLGHTSSRVTERVYARFAPDHLRDAAAALEVIL